MQVSRFEKILVCWDTEGKDVLSLAGRLAALNDGAVRLIACLPEPPAYRSMAVPNYSELATLAREALEEQLNKAVRRLSSRGVRAEWVISTCCAENALLKELESQPYDLVMVPAQKHGTEYATSKSTIQLMRKAPCPVWVVRPGRLGAKPKVLVTVAAKGPEDLNMRLILTANALSAHFGGELHVLSVWNAPGETMLRGRCHFAINAEDIRRYVEGSRDDCATSLKELLGRCGVALDRKRVHLLKGDPRLVIPRFCHDHGVAILVMGTVARTGFVGALLGNTAEEVAKSLPTSVVSVGPLAGSATGAEDLELAAAQGSNR